MRPGARINDEGPVFNETGNKTKESSQWRRQGEIIIKRGSETTNKCVRPCVTFQSDT